jgi:glycosyltransferase involved in cell wall biosynthesis
VSKRVLIFSPGGIELPGGVTRMVRYLTEAWARQADAPDFEIVDSRGAGHALWSPFYLARAAALLVWRRLRGQVSLVHVNYGAQLAAVRKSILILLASLLRIPILLHLHASSLDEFYRALPRPLQAALRASFTRADRVVVLGNSWRRFVVEVLGVAPERVVILPNAVPAPAGPRASRSGPCRIVFLGELGLRKGLPELLAALADARLAALAWRAVVAGNGDVAGWRRRATALGIGERVTFPGCIDVAATERLLDDADILALPSRAEGLPMSVLEAMAHGLAIVTTPVGAIGEAVRDGESALFVSPGDADALAAALQRLLEDASLRDRLGQAAQAKFADCFEIGGYARRLAGLYRSMLAKGS